MRTEKRIYQCDRSGEMFEKLYKQYEWAGNVKVWTGLWVGAKYLDKPNETLRTIKGPFDDPKPRKNPKPFTPGEPV